MKKRRITATVIFSLIICFAALKLGIAYVWRSSHSNSFCFESVHTDVSFSIEEVHTNTSVSFGDKHGAAITENGDLYTWGSNESGQLGYGEIGSYSKIPTRVPGIADVVSVSLGDVHSAAITVNGDLYTWGSNWHGQLGHGSNKRYSQYVITPTKVMSLPKVVAVSSAGTSTAVITDAGELYIWGFHDRAGNPRIVQDLTTIAAVNLGFGLYGFRNIATLADNGELYTWGAKGEVLGYSVQVNRFRSEPIVGSYMPKRVPNINNVIAVNLGAEHGAAITSDGMLYTWGGNWSGQVGHNSASYPELVESTRILDIANVVAVSLGGYHSATVTVDGELYTWGFNRSGQLAYYSSTYTDSGFQYTDMPTKVPGLADVVGVSLGYYNSAAITADGSLYTWGSTYGGLLGDGIIGERWDFRREPQKIMENVMIPNNGH